ncbi:MAG TPA: hypothetical protein VFI02_06930 [Armatimonadota bacterium]|nr:hypothetical protein [Armatimonadota bacterium]
MEKSKRDTLWGIGIALLVIGMLWVVLRFVAGPILEHRLFPQSEPDLATITTLTSVRFPPSARLVESRLSVHGVSEDIWAKIEIDKVDVDKFIAPFPKDWRATGLSFAKYASHPKKLPWWHPDTGKKLLTFLTSGEVKDSSKLFTLMMQINMDDAKKATIYLWWGMG